MNIYDYILLIVSTMLIILIIFQPSKDNINDAFSGSTNELFKNQKQRGSQLFLARLTLFFVASFIVLTYVTSVVFAERL